MIYVHIFIIILFFILIVFQNSFFQNLKKPIKFSEKTEQTLSSSLTILGLALIVGVLSGYVCYKTSDSIQVDLEDLPAEEINSVKVRRIVCISSFVVLLLAFGYAYWSIVHPVDFTPTSPTARDYTFYLTSDFAKLISEKLQLSPQVVSENLSAASQVQNNKLALVKFFDTFYGNVHLSEADISKFPPDARAYFVRLLLKVYQDPTYVHDVIIPQAELWMEFKAHKGPQPTQKLAYIHYLFALVFGYVLFAIFIFCSVHC